MGQPNAFLALVRHMRKRTATQTESEAEAMVGLARGGTVMLTETDNGDSKINMRILKEWQPMAANDSVAWARSAGPSR